MNKFAATVYLFFVFTCMGFSQINPAQDYLSINNIFMWIYNDGRSSHDPRTDGGGLFWSMSQNPQGVVYQDGLVWGGKVNGEVRVNGSTYRTGIKPGNMIDLNNFENPNDPLFGIWKLKENWEQTSGAEKDRYEYNYKNWPGYLGAPYEDVDHDGKFSLEVDKPKIFGDEMLWFVANDGDSAKSDSCYGSPPIGLELQGTVFGFAQENYLKDVVFKKYKLINKSQTTVEEMALSYWSDPDLGFAGDDFIGIDTTLQMSYCYNGDNNDEDFYGENPPAIGYLYLQNPYVQSAQSDSGLIDGKWRKGIKNIRIGANIPGLKQMGSGTFSDPPMNQYIGTVHWYNFMNGLGRDTLPMVDPNTQQKVKIALAGDPVVKTGWYEGEGWPNGPSLGGDRRLYTSTEKFTLAPEDTQEIVIAILLARGTSNLNSITELRNVATQVRDFYYSQFLTDVNDETVQPREFVLHQNFPNPFNPSTVISYQLSVSSKVSLKVYDILGNEVVTLVDEVKPAGKYQVNFNTQNTTNGKQLTSGVYFYQLHAGDFIQTKKMIILK
ncbi:MAG: T9SS type A sorting domain-containing protein [Ignavibacteriaceae bacterium]|jgi:hypothetical protein